jgi:Holliday junction resolvase RusA-like endonuclease
VASVSFFTAGFPAPGGSKRPWPIYRGKKGEKRVFTGKVALVDAGGERTKNWRQSVSASAFQAMEKANLKPFALPIRVSFIFWMPRPADHHRGGKRENQLKDDAPHWHAKAPDLLKLARSTEDAMTGIVYADDKLISLSSMEKLYVFTTRDDGERKECGYITGCSITVTELA